MASENLSPIEKIQKKRKAEKELSVQIYKKIFNYGVNKTAENFGIKPEEAIKLIIKLLRKNGEIGRLQDLGDKRKIAKICDKIQETGTFSTGKIYEFCKNFAEVWEIEVAKCILKEKIRQEIIENE